MPARLQHVRILSDGRAGHVNQSLGLALALQRRTGAEIETVVLDPSRSCLHRARAARTLKHGEAPPQLIIGAGHRTHLPLLAAGRAFKAHTIVIMDPSLRPYLFDLCLVPQHDIFEAEPWTMVIPTRGALNKLPEDEPVKLPRGLIMLGGPSSHHDWSHAPLLDAIAAVVRAAPHLEWTAGDSRRTPSGFLEELHSLRLPVQIAPCDQSSPDWLPQQLMAAEEVWVTTDSASMISEAVTARARTGVLPLPIKRRNSRVARAVEQFAADGMVTLYADWQSKGWPPHEPVRLHEAARCADEILSRFFA